MLFISPKKPKTYFTCIMTLF